MASELLSKIAIKYPVILVRNLVTYNLSLVTVFEGGVLASTGALKPKGHAEA